MITKNIFFSLFLTFLFIGGPSAEASHAPTSPAESAANKIAEISALQDQLINCQQDCEPLFEEFENLKKELFGLLLAADSTLENAFTLAALIIGTEVANEGQSPDELGESRRSKYHLLKRLKEDYKRWKEEQLAPPPITYDL